jgi:predicted DNA-binding transcriptional regulator YafY
MANTKDYAERELIIDRYLSTGKEYSGKELLALVNMELRKRSMLEIKTRTTFAADIQEINSKYFNHFHHDVIQRKKRGRIFYYSYRMPNFSIYDRELTDEEISKLHSLVLFMRRLKGMPKFSFLEEMEVRFDQVVNKAQKPVVSFDDSYNEQAMKPFTKLLEAINKQQVVNFEYCKFQDSEPTQNKVSPLYLKQYQLRWYLMASYIGNPNIYTFALDRMLHLENDAETPYEPTDVDFEHYFDDIIGVTNYQDKPVEHIEIWVKNKELPYVLSKPLHRSQQLLQKDVNGGALITIDVKRNTELKQAILSYGGYMEVMKPLDLRKELDEQASMMRFVYDTPEPG